jgi:predicted dienelactone hydrolase
MIRILSWRTWAMAMLALVLATRAAAGAPSMGLSQLPATETLKTVTVAYPSRSAATELRRGPFAFAAAWQGEPATPQGPGAGRLVVFSHGTGGSPWVQMDLARTLVEAGFVVAMPSHRGDDFEDASNSGPEAWKTRPAEISRTIDAIAAHPRLGPWLKLDRVGVYGSSAGGLTALTLAGAHWSPAQFVRHCDAYAAQDFPACAGLHARLNQGALDGLKIAVAQRVIRQRFNDSTWYTHGDPRIAAVVAGVPMVAPIRLTTLTNDLRERGVAVGLFTTGTDRWLAPKLHRDALAAACPMCVTVAHLPQGGHASTMSPWPLDQLGLPDYARWLLEDPADFDRATLPAAYGAIRDWLVQQLAP